MSSIQARLASTTANTRKDHIPPNIYPSTVVKVEYDTRYKDGAYILTYLLQGKSKTYTYEERFIDNTRFARTRKFYRYLAKNGIDEVEDFEGCHEEVDLRWDFTNTGKRELTIADRTFIGLHTKSVKASEPDQVE